MQKVYESIQDLKDNFSKDSGVYTIKSRLLFELLESKGILHSSSYQAPFPPTQIGSITVFEATILSSILRIKKVLKITEIGTYIGYSTAVFALNSHPAAKIISIDLPAEDVERIDGRNITRKQLQQDWRLNDNYLRSEQMLKGEVYIESLPKIFKKKIDLLKANSTKLSANQQAQCNLSDLVFIDGGHDYATIQSDSRLAKALIKDNGLIVWHDYNSQIHKEVTRYIDDEFSLEQAVFHIENSLFAFAISNPFKNFFGH